MLCPSACFIFEYTQDVSNNFTKIHIVILVHMGQITPYLTLPYLTLPAIGKPHAGFLSTSVKTVAVELAIVKRVVREGKCN
jgi:hypothetical protein